MLSDAGPIAVKLQPYVGVDEWLFTMTHAEVLRRHGAPLRSTRNAVGLTELDYGDAVLRFQDSGRLEEITQRAPVLYLGALDVPFAGLHDFVRTHDAEVFERVDFVVSPRLGLAFVPSEPDWVTALAAHCVATWRAL